MGDWDEDSDNIDFDDEVDDGDLLDDWEEEEGLMQEKEEKRKAKEAAELARKEERMRKAKEKRDRILAAKGELAEDEYDGGEIDETGDKEYKDLIERHEVEEAYAENTNAFSAKPLAGMQPETAEEYRQMGEKLGTCMKTFRSSKYFFHAMNILVTKTSDKIELEAAQELVKKLNVLSAERAKDIKDQAKRKAAAREDRVVADDIGEKEEGAADDGEKPQGRNDFAGDGKVLDDFM